MIVELRTYTLHPGKVSEYLSIYEEEGLSIQKTVLGNMLGYFSTEIGTLNQIVHMWGYEDLAERARRRSDLQSRPEWRAFVSKIRPLIQTQENKILLPTRFSPIS